jgi:flavin reductase (DIM6/NTAB) family NADH-FMN oxidoreductase RutF
LEIVKEKYYLRSTDMITIDPKEVTQPKLQGVLSGTIAPRPIALVSTIDKEGNVNLSPFSFFNIFSTNPPILVFSASRRGRDNTTKHTYENMLEVPEVVINIVSYDIVEQVSLTSVEFPKGVDEFVKSGLSPLPSTLVRPPLVRESPASFECVVKDLIELGKEGGAGILALCEVKMIHLREEILDENGLIDPQRVDAVARLGNDYYCRAHGENIFIVPKPNRKPAVGFDSIPSSIRKSNVLTGNDLGRLGNSEQLPTIEEVTDMQKDPQAINAINAGETHVHRLAHLMLQQGKVADAWKLLLAFHKTDLMSQK